MTLGISSMVNDVQTITSGNASWQAKLWAGADLLLNVGMDVMLVTGIGEEARGVYEAGKIGLSLLMHGGEDMALHEGEDLLTHAGEEEATHLAESGTCSFIAATRVMTATGELAIGTLHVGQKVLAYNPHTKKMELQPILHVWIHKDNDLVDLTLTTATHAPHSTTVTKTSETIHTNQKHPFLTKEKGFVPVGQLKLGMHVLRADGRIGVITGWKIVPGVKTMYNLEVAQDHTFVVGTGEWVVHNTCPINSSQSYSCEARNALGKTSSEASTQATLAREPMCHLCGVSPSTVADHEPALAQRWASGEVDNMTVDQARAAADDPNSMVGSCRSCNSSKSGRLVGTGPGEWDPRSSPPNRLLGGPGVLPWIW